MSIVRPHLSLMIVGWLSCQVAGVAAAPLALCCQAVPAGDHDEKCCPGLLPGQVCPMHHTREGNHTCKMRSGCGRADAALMALAGGLGELPQTTALVTAFDPGTFIATASPSAILRVHLPESPPSRG